MEISRYKLLCCGSTTYINGRKAFGEPRISIQTYKDIEGGKR
jgi:hypothetical protein